MIDYVIIGGGPCGLTIALYLSELGKKCVLIDKNENLGGCHRVTRVEDDLFTEHGPRIYSSAYYNVDTILKKIGTSWDDTFVKSKFSIGGNMLSQFSIKEMFVFGIEIFKMVLGINTKNQTVKEFADKHNFSEKTKDYMNRICRLTDGAGDDRYSIHQFMQLFNQNFLHTLYQPRKPNDQYLFKLWEEKLLENNVAIFKDTDVLAINDNIVKTNFGEIICKKIVICIPPKPFLKLSQNSFIQNKSLYEIWGEANDVNISEWVEKNSYINDIPITFHWEEPHELPKIWGFPRNDWGIAFVVLTDYMKPENGYKLVISTCITIQDFKSKFTHKTAQESNREELVSEVFRQLKASFPSLPNPDKSIIHPKISRENNQWVEQDTAYFKQTFIQSHTKFAENIYYVGTQNGNSYYNFTSMESAVTNALFAVNKMENVDICIRKPREVVFFYKNNNSNFNPNPNLNFKI